MIHLPWNCKKEYNHDPSPRTTHRPPPMKAYNHDPPSPHQSPPHDPSPPGLCKGIQPRPIFSFCFADRSIDRINSILLDLTVGASSPAANRPWWRRIGGGGG
ncbi:hypothetical protein Drorol1_Dr00008474 [Drosera rotundifolia]